MPSIQAGGIPSAGANGGSIPDSALEQVCDMFPKIYINIMDIQMMKGMLWMLSQKQSRQLLISPLMRMGNLKSLRSLNQVDIKLKLFRQPLGSTASPISMSKAYPLYGI